MKKIKYLLIIFVAFLILPFAVFADEEQNTTEGAKEEVNLYFFRGEGCPHCEEAEEWFKSIEEEYGSMFKIVDYEVWNNQDNAKLMEDVANARDEEASGVPYIIIGNKSWNGFAEDYEQEIIDQIKSEYDKSTSDRYDIMKLLPNIKSDSKKKESDSGSDVLVLVIIVVALAGICFGIYKARDSVN